MVTVNNARGKKDSITKIAESNNSLTGRKIVGLDEYCP